LIKIKYINVNKSYKNLYFKYINSILYIFIDFYEYIIMANCYRFNRKLFEAKYQHFLIFIQMTLFQIQYSLKHHWVLNDDLQVLYQLNTLCSLLCFLMVVKGLLFQVIKHSFINQYFVTNVIQLIDLLTFFIHAPKLNDFYIHLSEHNLIICLRA
jgi:hypothetical protein